MTNERNAQFVDLYDKCRVQDQRDWYGARADEYERSANQIRFLNQLLLLAAGACGIVASVFPEVAVGLGIAAASLAALGVALTSWADVVGFSANAASYREAQKSLGLLYPERPDETADDAEIEEYFDRTEAILLREVQLWTEQTQQSNTDDGAADATAATTDDS